MHLRARAAPNTYWFSIPNGGARSAIEAKIMQGTGTRKGCPDMCFIATGRRKSEFARG